MNEWNPKKPPADAPHGNFENDPGDWSREMSR